MMENIELNSIWDRFDLPLSDEDVELLIQRLTHLPLTDEKDVAVRATIMRLLIDDEILKELIKMSNETDG